MATYYPNQQGYRQDPNPSAFDNMSDSQNQKYAFGDANAYSYSRPNAEIKIETDVFYQSKTANGASGNTPYAGSLSSGSTSIPPENLPISDPERVDVQRHGISASKVIDFTKKRTKSLLTLADKIILEESEYISSEKVYLDQTRLNLENIKNRVRVAVNQDNQEAKEIQGKIDALASEKQKRTKDAEEANAQKNAQEIDLERANKEVTRLNILRKDIANRIHPLELSHGKLTEKCALHNLFAWSLVVIYGEQEVNYYWDNFRKEAFVKDKGNDFRARLRGLKYKMNSEQILITQRIIKEAENIRGEIVKNNYSNKSMLDLLEYVKVMNDINNQLDTIKGLDAKQEKALQEAEVKNFYLEEVTVQTEGYQSRLNMITQFNKSFDKILSNLEKVQGQCQQRGDLQAGLAERMKQDLSSLKISQLDAEETYIPKQEHEHIHGNVKSPMKETVFTDGGKKAQSCQECTIF